MIILPNFSLQENGWHRYQLLLIFSFCVIASKSHFLDCCKMKSFSFITSCFGDFPEIDSVMCAIFFNNMKSLHFKNSIHANYTNSKKYYSCIAQNIQILRIVFTCLKESMTQQVCFLMVIVVLSSFPFADSYQAACFSSNFSQGKIIILLYYFASGILLY